MKRLLAFPLVRLVLTVICFALLATPAVLGAARFHGIALRIAVNLELALSLVVAIALVERFAAGRRFAATFLLDPRYATRGLGAGMLLGAALFSLVVLELAFAGYYRVSAIHVSPDLALAALLLLADAAVEELLFRGVIFRLIEEWNGTWIALAVSALLFGFAHAANPGATAFSSLAIALEAGILLGAAFVVTRNLWLPIGLHFAWNFFEGPVFGSQVSGHVFGQSAIAARIVGPAFLTGGRFGPEAGVFAVIPCLLVAVALLIYAAHRSLIVAPAWRKGGALPVP